MDVLVLLALHAALMLGALRLMVRLVPSRTVRNWLDRMLWLLARAAGQLLLFGLHQLHYLLLRGVELLARRVNRLLDRDR